jgi:hypothetical protein
MADRDEMLTIKGIKISPELFNTGYPCGVGPWVCPMTCCARGAYVDLGERDRILEHADEIRKHMDETQSLDSSTWFEKDELNDHDFVSGKCVGTNVLNGKCTLADKHGRCTAQLASVALGRHKWDLKPIYCVMFPVETIDNVLKFNPRHQNERPCCTALPEFETPLFEACREEIVHVLGEDGYATMQAHYESLLAQKTPSAG